MLQVLHPIKALMPSSRSDQHHHHLRKAIPVGAMCDSYPGSFYCDDFETYPLGQAPSEAGRFSSEVTDGSASVEDGKSYSGKKAVRLQTQAGDGFRSAMITLGGAGGRRLVGGNGTSSSTSSPAPIFPVQGNAFYGRMMFFLEAAPTRKYIYAHIYHDETTHARKERQEGISLCVSLSLPTFSIYLSIPSIKLSTYLHYLLINISMYLSNQSTYLPIYRGYPLDDDPSRRSL